MIIFYIILFLLLLVVYKNAISKERLTSKPNPEQLEQMSNLIMDNSNLFDEGSSFRKAKKKIKWIDVIIYEDMRKLKRNNQFNKISIMNSINN